jgi:hypothetical protein
MTKKIVFAAMFLAILAVAIFVYFHRVRQPVPISEDLIVPVYPGAVSASGGFAQRLSPEDRAKLIKAAIFKTKDEPGKVIEFYKQKLDKGKTQVIETSHRGIPSAVFRTDVNDTPRVVIISNDEDTGETEITISSIALPE